MASFNDLPVETIDFVCVYLRYLGSFRYNTTDYTPAARKGLVSLCQTSRKFHSIALAHLYHHVNINDYEARLVPFARTLFENQTFADLVHELDLEQCFNIPIDPVLQDHFLCHPVTSMPSAKLHLNGWSTQYAGYHGTRALEILLIRLRKLRFIDLAAQNSHFADEVFMIIKDKHLHDLEFRNYFKEVTLSCRKLGETIDLAELIPFLSSTSIRRLAVVRCLNIEGYFYCRLPSLLEVRLLDCVLTYEDFVALVKWCPNLELLRHELGSMLVEMDDHAPASAAEITTAIAPLHKSLRTLILYQNPYFLIEHEHEAIENLRDFTELKNLVIGFHDLTGEEPTWDEEDEEDEEDEDDSDDSETGSHSTEGDVNSFYSLYMDSLPESLENLCIIDAKSSLGDGLQELGKMAKRDYPHLRSLIVDESFDLKGLFSDLRIDYQEVDHDALMRICRGRGLEDLLTTYWRQVHEHRANSDQGDVTFNKSYSRSIRSYYISTADQATLQLDGGSQEAKSIA